MRTEPDGDAASGGQEMRLRYAGTCAVCGVELGAGTWAVYEQSSKTVRCIRCPGQAAPDTGEDVGVPDGEVAPGAQGSAGASARREFERRKARREEQIRAKHPKVGGLILALSDEPQSTRAWATGAEGEVRLGRRLDSLASASVGVLHDRRIPGTRANIDHIVTCPSGVFVIDAKNHKGRPQLKVEGGILRARTEKLMVGSRDRSTLVDGVLKQVGLVQAVLAQDEVPVHGVLCFVAADWPVIGGAFRTRGVHVLWPKKLASLLGAEGPLHAAPAAEIHQRVATTFPPA
jgi:hypothetical protein